MRTLFKAANVFATQPSRIYGSTATGPAASFARSHNLEGQKAKVRISFFLSYSSYNL